MLDILRIIAKVGFSFEKGHTNDIPVFTSTFTQKAKWISYILWYIADEKVPPGARWKKCSDHVKAL